MDKDSNHKRENLPPIRLPFSGQSTVDIGTWSYNNRRGICVTLIAYLLFGIVFVSSKITISERKESSHMLLDFADEDSAEVVPPEIELPDALYSDFSDVRNLISNVSRDYGAGLAGGELNPSLSDAKGMDASQIYDDAEALNEQMQVNREAYEAGLASERAIMGGKAGAGGRQSGANTPQEGAAANRVDTSEDSRVKGLVTVSFEFTDPIRTSVNLIIPAYRCQSGGEVVVDVVLDQNGYVVSSTLNRSLSSTDQCMINTAIDSAKESRFNTDSGAPQKHKGTISYIFIPQ